MFESIVSAWKAVWAWVRGRRQDELDAQHEKNAAAADAEVKSTADAEAVLKGKDKP